MSEAPEARIVDKIRKALERANDENNHPEERETARAFAMKLAAKYHVEEIHLRDSQEEAERTTNTIKLKADGANSWWHEPDVRLAIALGDVYGGYTMTHKYWDHAVIHMTAYPSQNEIIKELYYHFIQQRDSMFPEAMDKAIADGELNEDNDKEIGRFIIAYGNNFKTTIKRRLNKYNKDQEEMREAQAAGTSSTALELVADARKNARADSRARFGGTANKWSGAKHAEGGQRGRNDGKRADLGIQKRLD